MLRASFGPRVPIDNLSVICERTTVCEMIPCPFAWRIREYSPSYNILFFRLLFHDANRWRFAQYSPGFPLTPVNRSPNQLRIRSTETFIKEIPIDGSQVDADRSRLQELHVTNDDGDATPTIASPSDAPESVPERLLDSHIDYIPPVTRESTLGKSAIDGCQLEACPPSAVSPTAHQRQAIGVVTFKSRKALTGAAASGFLSVARDLHGWTALEFGVFSASSASGN